LSVSSFKKKPTTKQTNKTPTIPLIPFSNNRHRHNRQQQQQQKRPSQKEPKMKRKIPELCVCVW
jgi:hypothetical protein